VSAGPAGADGFFSSLTEKRQDDEAR